MNNPIMAFYAKSVRDYLLEQITMVVEGRAEPLAAEGPDLTMAPDVFLAAEYNDLSDTYAYEVCRIWAEPTKLVPLCYLSHPARDEGAVPLDRISTDGLNRIYDWLVKNHFPVEKHDPWRCEECGSLAVQDHVWLNANTNEIDVAAQGRDESYCNDCEAHTYHIRESELLGNIRKWLDTVKITSLEYASGLSRADFPTEKLFRAACVALWEGLPIDDKFSLWGKNQ